MTELEGKQKFNLCWKSVYFLLSIDNKKCVNKLIKNNKNICTVNNIYIKMLPKLIGSGLVELKKADKKSNSVLLTLKGEKIKQEMFELMRLNVVK